MHSTPERGSARLREAWQKRTLSEEAIEAIANNLDDSGTVVEQVGFTGGEHATGVTLGLAYADDDIPICGNDLLFWLRWHRKFGAGTWVPPKIIINGIPHPDLVRIRLTFGEGPAPVEQVGLDQVGLGG